MALEIRPLATAADAQAGAALMAASEPWQTLRRDEGACLALLGDPARERYAAWVDGAFAGVLVLNLRGAFVGYLQAICVAPAFRGQGVGTALVAFAEARIFQDHPNVFLCVSAFNPGARGLYERLGYTLVGELPDFVVPGQTELLMRKTVGPLDGHRPSVPAPPPGPAFPLARTFVVLDGQYRAHPAPVTPTLYADLDRDHDGFRGCVLVAEHAFDRDWPTWERHPAGDELLYLLEGGAELRLWRQGAEEAFAFDRPGQAVLIPRGVWHTARVAGPCRILFLTPGEGTENRPYPMETP